MTTIALSGTLIRFFNFAPKLCMRRSWKTEGGGKKHADKFETCRFRASLLKTPGVPNWQFLATKGIRV
jgi:hypothetical protein